MLPSDDGLAPGSDQLVKAIRDDGGKRVTARHEATDHGWSGKRITLEAAVIGWLQALP